MATEPEQAIIRAAIYTRVSTLSQGHGHSPEVQRLAMQQRAAADGALVVMTEEDHESGSKVTRAGYQRILAAARAGTIDRIYVYMWDRFGRDGVEWLDRARELERLGIPLVSVQEGQSQRGILRYVVAGMAEEYSIKLAQRVRPAREASARRGVHQGQTPHLGYTRVYDPPQNGRRQAGRLVPDEATAWIVRTLFERYATGTETLRTLAAWLNEDDRVPAHPEGTAWMPSSVRSMLRNPTYAGLVRFNHERRGMYESSAPGDEFVVEGVHEALVSRDLFGRVQEVMRRAAEHTSRRVPLGPEPSLLPGLLRCAGCGGPMSRHRNRRGHATRYECVYRRRAANGCQERSVRGDLADAAVLREVARLRVATWTPAVDMALLGRDTPSKELAQTERALERERDRLRRHTRLLSALGDDPSAEQVAAYQEVSAEMAERIRTLDARCAELRTQSPAVVHLRDLHARLQADPPATDILTMQREGRVAELKAYLARLMDSARITERVPPGYNQDCVWLRAEVVWSPEIRHLLRAGALTEEPPPETPVVETAYQRKLRKDRAKKRWLTKPRTRQR